MVAYEEWPQPDRTTFDGIIEDLGEVPIAKS